LIYKALSGLFQVVAQVFFRYLLRNFRSWDCTFSLYTQWLPKEPSQCQFPEIHKTLRSRNSNHWLFADIVAPLC